MPGSEAPPSKLALRPLPRTFVLELTRRCNHACLYCYTAWGAPELNYPPGDHHELSTRQVFTIIDRLQDECPLETIAISGGEPLLRDDLPEILAFIKGRGLTSVVITNGMLLTQERVSATRLAGAFEVTLLSTHPEVHDRLAGCWGAWDAALDGCLNLREAGSSLIVAFIATRLNYQHLRQTAELALVLKATALMYNRLNLARQNIARADLLLPTPVMVQENLDTLEVFSEKYGLPVSISVVCEPCVIDTTRYHHIHFGFCPLGDEESYFTIDPAGNLRICNHSPVILGNLLCERFGEIYRRNPYLQSFRETWPAECQDCQPAWKAICRGGCKAAAEQVYGTFNKVDPFVQLYKR